MWVHGAVRGVCQEEVRPKDKPKSLISAKSFPVSTPLEPGTQPSSPGG